MGWSSGCICTEVDFRTKERVGVDHGAYSGGIAATASMTARTAASMLLDTNDGDDPPLKVTREILMEVP